VLASISLPSSSVRSYNRQSGPIAARQVVGVVAEVPVVGDIADIADSLGTVAGTSLFSLRPTCLCSGPALHFAPDLDLGPLSRDHTHAPITAAVGLGNRVW
jgi:hypothetical protein